jgi:hypothetical protein
MEFARNVLISVTHIQCKGVFRFAFLRSNLFRHHIGINLSNLSVLHLDICCLSARQVLR